MTTKLPNGSTIYEIVVKYAEWSYNITIFPIPRPTKMYPNWDFWYKTYHLATLIAIIV
jgi:hypothetical protein